MISTVIVPWSDSDNTDAPSVSISVANGFVTLELDNREITFTRDDFDAVVKVLSL